MIAARVISPATASSIRAIVGSESRLALKRASFRETEKPSSEL
jgi:hypothetical protein